MKTRHMAKRTLMGLMLAVLLAGCGGDKDKAPGSYVMQDAEHERWEIALVEMRIEKNEQLANPESTALPDEKLPGFEGLNYYFPAPTLRFKTPFVAEAGADTVRLTKRQGQSVPYLRRGKVAFAWRDRTYELSVFGPADASSGDYLWLPFFDSTNGQDTYGGGRYLDVTVDAEGLVDLDFNYAYNPLCDYNPARYNCTLPPQENTLDFAVEAGEKTFGTSH